MYRGWRITYSNFAPVMVRWCAVRFGVGMCAGDEAALKRVIDAKIGNEG